MVTNEITNKPRPTEYKKPDLSKYKEGKFSHRTATDGCDHFGGACPVRKQQKDPEEDICTTFCIPRRDDLTAIKRRR